MVKSIKAVRALVMAASGIFLLWLAVSWVDVVAHNAAPMPEYKAWNAFVIFFARMGWAV